MLKKIGLGLLAVVILILAVAGFQSAEYTISRSIVINAPAEKIFPYLNNQKLYEKWSPWIEEDPKAVMTYSGPDEGVGAKSSWVGEKLGTGSATIVNVTPNQKVDILLEYTEPMGMKQDAEYLITAEGTANKVTWAVHGKNNYLMRVMCLFFNMDKLVGSSFEKGLAKLKIVTEGS